MAACLGHQALPLPAPLLGPSLTSFESAHGILQRLDTFAFENDPDALACPLCGHRQDWAVVE